MVEKIKIKCKFCEKKAVIIENNIYYCGPCAVKNFITGVHKRLGSKPCNNYSESNNKGR